MLEIEENLKKNQKQELNKELIEKTKRDRIFLDNMGNMSNVISINRKDAIGRKGRPAVGKIVFNDPEGKVTERKLKPPSYNQTARELIQQEEAEQKTDTRGSIKRQKQKTRKINNIICLY